MRIYFIPLFLLGSATALQVQAQDSGQLSAKALPNFAYEKPVFKLEGEQLENTNRMLHYYAFTGYREGVVPIKGSFNVNFSAKIDTLHGAYRIKMFNLSIVEMLTHGLEPSEAVVLEVKDPSKYRYDPAYGDKLAWFRKNGHCFEMVLPIGVMKNIKLVEDEICRHFKISYTMEKRIVNGKENEVYFIREI